MIHHLSKVFSKSLTLSKALSITNSPINAFHTSPYNLFRITQSHFAEPTKAKKRIDPVVLQLRENRKKKRIEKEIKKMERLGRKLKPIEELEPDRAALKEAEVRKRPMKSLSKEEEDEEFFLRKEWASFMAKQHANQMDQLERALRSQEKALNELKKDNIDLYNKAIQIDTKLLPYLRDGPVHTPPNKNYEPPEGDYQDVTYLYDRRI